MQANYADRQQNFKGNEIQNAIIEQWSEGYDPYVTRDLNDDIGGRTIGIDVIQPLPDVLSNKPIVVCDASLKRVQNNFTFEL